ncbi:MAG: ThiF family adenylyltransferase [Thermoleophilia bacterium]
MSFPLTQRLSVALPTTVADELRQHLLREDGQEDLCFCLWHASRGGTRTTALLKEVVLPLRGEREVHENAAFQADYFLRAAALAQDVGAGLALLHSHPRGQSWQGLSPLDRRAEAGHAGQTVELTDRPLVGLTLAGDGTWSARLWERVAHRTYAPQWCETVREVGTHLRISFNDRLRPKPTAGEELERALEAWGPGVQATFARLRVGIVGVGSVGAQIGEALARSGFGEIVLLDFDTAKRRNLDRTLHLYVRDSLLHRAKTFTLARGMRRSATHPDPRVRVSELSVCEPDGFRVAADCDVLFSCVDRPWARQVLNLLAYAHLVPVIDGGVDVDARGGFRDARMGAHMVAPGRKCLSCLGQYDAGDVSADRDGSLDDPLYIQGLPTDHRLRRGANVYAFGMLAASMELLQLILAVAAPSGQTDIGAQLYSAKIGTIDLDMGECHPGCSFSTTFLAQGDDGTPPVTGVHRASKIERERRERASEKILQHLVRRLDDIHHAGHRLLDRMSRSAR